MALSDELPSVEAVDLNVGNVGFGHGAERLSNQKVAWR